MKAHSNTHMINAFLKKASLIAFSLSAITHDSTALKLNNRSNSMPGQYPTPSNAIGQLDSELDSNLYLAETSSENPTEVTNALGTGYMVTAGPPPPNTVPVGTATTEDNQTADVDTVNELLESQQVTKTQPEQLPSQDATITTPAEPALAVEQIEANEHEADADLLEILDAVGQLADEQQAEDIAEQVAEAVNEDGEESDSEEGELSGTDESNQESGTIAPTVEATTSEDEEVVEDSEAVSAVKSFVEELSGEAEPAAVDAPIINDPTPEANTAPSSTEQEISSSDTPAPESEVNENLFESIEVQQTGAPDTEIPTTQPAAEIPVTDTEIPTLGEQLAAEQEATVDEVVDLDSIIKENNEQEASAVAEETNTTPDEEPTGDSMGVVLPEQMQTAQIHADHRLYEPMSLAQTSTESGIEYITFAEQFVDPEMTPPDSASFGQKVNAWIKARPYFLISIAISSVLGCCFLSQILLKFSKQCNLSLNRYYIRKRFEKQKMMTNTIQQTQILRQEQAARKRRDDEETNLIIEERGHGRQDDENSEIQEEESQLEFTRQSVNQDQDQVDE